MTFTCGCGRKLVICLPNADALPFTDAAVERFAVNLGWTPAKPPGMFRCRGCSAPPPRVAP